MDSRASPAGARSGDLSALPAKDVFSRLGSSPQGLSGAEAARRLLGYG